MRNWIDLFEQQWPTHVTNAELTAFNREGDEDGYHADDDTVYFDGRGATLQRVPIAGLQFGNDTDQDVVDIYASRTTEAPPIIIDGNTVENGNHRLAAAKARGEESILAYRLDESSGQPSMEYDTREGVTFFNGFGVTATLSGSEQGLQIDEFTSAQSGQGNGEKAVRWLADQSPLHVCDPGDPGSDSMAFWTRMADKGLIASMEDKHGDIIYQDGEWTDAEVD